MDRSLLLVACLAMFCNACSDHEKGYRDGYAGHEMPAWLLHGKQAYLEGYQRGQAQVFQDDWYAANVADIDPGRSCPAIVIRADALNFKEKIGITRLD